MIKRYPIENIPSPHFDERPEGLPIDFLIIHGTVVPFANALDILTKTVRSRPQVSAHYLIDTKGKIVSLVDEKMRAWHAGLSFWQGVEKINDRSIGIELESNCVSPYPKEQIDALVYLVKKIMKKHAIPKDRVLAHSDIAVGRKVDPGPFFPWEEIARLGIGVHPALAKKPKRPKASPPLTAELVHTYLEKLGYKNVFHKAQKNQDDQEDHAVYAFLLHYYPKFLQANLPIVSEEGIPYMSFSENTWHRLLNDREFKHRLITMASQ